MTYSLFIIISIISYSFCSDSKVYTFNFGENDPNIKSITLCIGTKNKKPINCHPFIFSSLINKLHVFKNSLKSNCYNPERSDTFSKTRIKISSYLEDDFFHGEVAKDNIYFHNTPIFLTDIQFIFVANGLTNKPYCGVFGFYFDNFASEKYFDILRQLKDNGYIEHSTVKFTNNILIIGDTITYKKNMYNRKINILKNNSIAGILSFKISSTITLGNNNTIIWEDCKMSIGSFAISRNYIWCTRAYFNFLIKKFFYNYFDNRECLIKVIDNLNRIYCIEKVITSLSNERLFIFINNWSLRFVFKDIFIDSNNDKGYKEFLIAFSNNYHYQWVIGDFYLKDKVISIDKDDGILLIDKNF